MRIFNLFSIHTNSENQYLKVIINWLSAVEINPIFRRLMNVKEATFYRIHASFNLKIYDVFNRNQYFIVSSLTKAKLWSVT